MSTKLWYNKYVDDWMHALPLGNGRVGAMFYGNPHKETIEINEESLWSGKQIKERNHATAEDLKKVRELIFEHRLQEAAELSRRTFLADPIRVRFYESFGEIFIDFDDKSEYVDYHKELELSTAIASATWKKSDAEFSSECFVSEEYDAMVYRICSSDKSFSCNVTMKREQDAYTAALSKDTLLLNGRVTYATDDLRGEGAEGVSFGARIKIMTDGQLEEHHSFISVSDATYLILYAAFATNYDVNKFDIDESKDYRAFLSGCIDRIEKVSYEDIRAKHIEDHGKWFSTVRFELDSDAKCDEPTDLRLAKFKEGHADDPDLYTLYYNFGRYLLTESSGKKATLPANLQGIWCHGFRPPWGSDYHTNINLQMNYWPADSTNCSATFEPLIHFMKMLCEFGKQTARDQFGADGWCINHTTDIFGRTGVHDSVDCGFFPMAGPWMCLNLWEHYEYTNDKGYLKDIYPILEGACRFVLDYLCEAPNGYLTTSPSNSPENKFYYNEPNGECKTSMLTQGATIDFEIIYALLTRTAYACRLLGNDASFAQKLEDTLDRLPPLKVSERYGTVREWCEDYEEQEPGHRHMSPLFALHPSDQINETTPELFEAAKNTIARRLAHGCGQSGWSRAWIINFYARLKDGDSAHKHVDLLFAGSTEENLFDMHPPCFFQIDGNFGAIAGITEMLIQSHLGRPDERIIELLPALPTEWHSGTLSGVKTRGGFIFDIVWKNGKLVTVRVNSPDGRALLLKLRPEQAKVSSSAEIKLTDGLLEYKFAKNETITLFFN
ncbi:MAG: glycoside hydrolase family 95 protein [Ruminococcaceae bacterium]|nr:glycoside hydrolase family 95 protein [Oscillospiraceae bacterium]